MPPIDIALLVNGVVAGFVGLIFGIVGGYVTYRRERKRDDLRWDRDLRVLEQQFKHDKEQLEASWQLKLQELQIQFLREDQNRLRSEILRGRDNPIQEIMRINEYRDELLRRHAEWAQMIVIDLHEKGVDRDKLQKLVDSINNIKEITESQAITERLLSTGTNKD